MPDQHLPPPSWPTGPSSPDGPDDAPPHAGSPSDDHAEPPPPPTAPGSNPWSVPGEEPVPTDTPGGWAPPPTPRRSGWRGWVVALAIVALVVVGAVVGLSVGGDDEGVTAGTSDDASRPGDGDETAPTTPTTPRSTETGDLSTAEAEAHRVLFEAIDESERTMIGLNDLIAEAPQDASDEQLGAFRDEAGAMAGDLQDLHDDLAALDDGGSDAVSTIRDDYADHLQAWIDWSEAVAGDPTLLTRPDAAAPYFQAINFTAEGFTAAVDNNLDRSRVPNDVLDLADRIIDRGFTSEDSGTEI